MVEVEAPAILLPSAVLAHEAIEPALESAGQIEISPVDGQHERPSIDDAGVRTSRAGSVRCPSLDLGRRCVPSTR